MSGMLAKFRQGLRRSREGLSSLFQARGRLDDTAWEDIEDGLILADCGADVAAELIEKAKKSKKNPKEALKEAMLELFKPAPPIRWPEQGPFVLLVVGVNGTGKTTSIGKLAHRFRLEGKRVLIAAADTFRAAALEQLGVWADRAGAEIVRQQTGADPAAVAFDAVQRACARGIDVVIVDTAGRVQTDQGLMNELAKVRRVIGKAVEGAPHEVWQVVDAATGYNAVIQVERFLDAAQTTGLIVTKLDGTAKGGVVLQIARRFSIPVRFVGVGEGMEDFLPFEPEDFVSGLLP